MFPKGGNMKFLKVAMVLAIAFCLTASVYAETTSVKVSGDLTPQIHTENRESKVVI